MKDKFRDVHEAARTRYASYLEKYRNSSPVYFERRLSRRLGFVGVVLKLIGFSIYGLYKFLFEKPSHSCFVFEGTRFSELHALLPPERVVILGGWRARKYCAQKGYGFEWDGYIKNLFLIFYHRNTPCAINLLNFIVRVTVGRRISNGGALFLFEDTVPLGVSLSVILREHAPVVCISHGYTVKPLNDNVLLPDGEACGYNFLYDVGQQSDYLNSGSKCFMLGLPYEVPEIIGIDGLIVLVGQAEPDTPEEYDYCLMKMGMLTELLQLMGYSSVYRVRPGIDATSLHGIFPNLHQGSKLELLGGGRKIFIGYNSTLLYEAGVCGHITIGMNEEELEYERRFKTNLQLNDLSLVEVQRTLVVAKQLLDETPLPKSKSLDKRFAECMTSLDRAIQLDDFPKILKE